MTYSDIDKQKTAFIFELDNVIYPEKDYLFQVYYLFASAIEYTDLIDAKAATDLMVSTYINEGAQFVFERVKEQLGVDEKYRKNFDNLLLTVKLPLKLLIYKNVLQLMQEIVVDRKKIFIVTDGDPQQQLNKIRQTEWNGLEQYLICYFTQESKPKPDTDAIELLLKDNNLKRRDILMIGNSVTDELCAATAGVDYYNVSALLEV
jgi:phosphoglycolate phosphatase-like HAD superfamily hydrolase